jgi:DNA-binding response OmpR family regulator
VQLASRREYWRECCLNLAGIEYDASRRCLLCDRGSAYFTPRESQLLEVFLQHPNQTFSSRQLLQQAWHDEDLSEEQIRTYVVRIRQKLDGLGIRGRLSSVARQGYGLHFHE